MPRDLLPRLLVYLRHRKEHSCIIISGEVGAGKTLVAKQLVAALKRLNIVVGGILSPRIVQDGATIGYTVCDLTSGEERPFTALHPPGIVVGRFFIDQETLDLARRAIEGAARNAQVVFVDEVGRLELQGAGLASAVHTLLNSSALPVLLIRDSFVPAVVKTFSINQYIPYHIC